MCNDEGEAPAESEFSLRFLDGYTVSNVTLHCHRYARPSLFHKDELLAVQDVHRLSKEDCQPNNRRRWAILVETAGWMNAVGHVSVEKCSAHAGVTDNIWEGSLVDVLVLLRDLKIWFGIKIRDTPQQQATGTKPNFFARHIAIESPVWYNKTRAISKVSHCQLAYRCRRPLRRLFVFNERDEYVFYDYHVDGWSSNKCLQVYEMYYQRRAQSGR